MEESDEKIVYRQLSYKITGLLFKVHRELGKHCREQQYGDALEKLLTLQKMNFEREKPLLIPAIDRINTNVVDFTVDGKILIDLKAKPFVTKDDYYQMNRYLDACGYRLGLIVNFHNMYLKPIRVLHQRS
ncbi:MAG: GxxExxY protein [bacterium]|nr:GxxExxY protein [bacterium]